MKTPEKLKPINGLKKFGNMKNESINLSNLPKKYLCIKIIFWVNYLKPCKFSTHNSKQTKITGIEPNNFTFFINFTKYGTKYRFLTNVAVVRYGTTG